MAANDNAQRYKEMYKTLLSLYPVSYQRRFSKPMLQTFSDLCRERVQSGKGLFTFAMQTYAGTFVEIIKEQYKEGVVSNKKRNIKILAVAGIVIIGAVVATVIALNGNGSARVISPLSSLEQARELSKGKKAACLMDSQAAHDAVNNDDRMIDFGDEKISNFELAASNAIIDVPAGTEYKLTINSYEGGIAKGAMAYEYEYGLYNYQIKKLPADGDWELLSVVACERS